MRDYAILCKGTRKYASLASICEAPFCARVASLHASKYAPTPLKGAITSVHVWYSRQIQDVLVMSWKLVVEKPFFVGSTHTRSRPFLQNRQKITPVLGESTDRQTELEIILQHSIPRVYTSPQKESERSLRPTGSKKTDKTTHTTTSN